MSGSMRRIIRRIFNILKWTTIAIAALLALIIIVVNLPQIHDYALKKGVAFFNDKTRGHLTVEAINLRLPRHIQLSGLELKHPDGQKIIAVDNIEIEVTWPALFNKSIVLDHVNLSGLNGSVETDSDGNWNYQFIIDGFASDSAAIKDTTSSAWDFGIDHLLLQNNHLAYINQQTGDSMRFDIGTLALEMENFSVLNNEYVIDEIEIENSRSLIQIGETVDDEPDTSKSSLPLFGLSSLALNNVEFTYQSPDKNNRYGINIGAFDLEIDQFDLNEMQFGIDQIALTESQITINTPPSDSTRNSTDSISTPIDIFSPLFLTCDELALTQIDFNLNESDVRLEALEVELENIDITPDSYSIQFNKATGIFNKETQLDKFEGIVTITKQQTTFNNIQIAAMNSQVDLNGNLMYDTLSTLIEKGKYTRLNLENLEAFIDPLLVNPFLPEGYQLKENQEVSIETAINGPYEQTSIDHFNLSIGKSIIDFQGVITGEDWALKSYEIRNFTSVVFKRDINNLLVAAHIDTTYIPTELQFKLDGQYSSDYLALNGKLKTPFGHLNIEAKDKSGIADGQEIDLSIQSNKMDIGNYLKLTDSLVFDLNVSAEVSLAENGPNGFGHIVIDTLQYGKSSIHHLDITTHLEGDNYSVDLMIADSFIVGELCAIAMIDSNITASLEGNIKGIDFKSLGLSPSDLRGTFAIDANYAATNQSQELATKISEIMLIRDNKRVDLNPIEAGIYMSSDSTVASVQSEPFHLNSKSNRSVNEITQSIVDLLGGGNTMEIDPLAFWEVEFEITDVPEIRELLFPELKTLEPAHGSIDFVAAEGTIQADVEIPKVQYANYSLQDFRFTALGDSANLSSELNIGNISVDTIGIKNILFTTKTKDNTTALKLKILSDSTNIKYEFNGEIQADSASYLNGYNLHLDGPLILNTVAWNIDSLNQIGNDTKGMHISNLTFSHDSDSLTILKVTEDQKLVVQASSFDLTFLSGVLDLPDHIVQGQLFGELTVHNNGSFAGKGYIDEFTVSHGRLGKFEWDATKQENLFLIDINSDGEDIKLATTGKITPQNNEISQFDFDIDVKKINMEAMPRILPSIFFDGAGQLNGKVKFTGTNEKPIIVGKMGMDNVTMGLKANGGLYDINHQTIDIAADKIQLENFTITDTTGQELTVNGHISHTYFQNLKTDLSIETDEFTIFNLRPEENNRIYGKLLAGSNIQVKGDIASPSVEASINVSDKTDMTYVVPKSNYEEGIDTDLIEWTDFQTNNELGTLLTGRSDNSSRIAFVENSLDLTGSLFIDQDAIFKVVVDSAAGDFVEIRGDGKIGVSYDRSGNIRMNGAYQVASGFYKMTFYDIVKRQFDFQKGSSIIWNGSPMDATLNFTAMYKTNASVANLMSTGNNSSSVQTFNEQLPFEVLMSMTGDLSKPQISFSIDLAQERKGAYGGAVEAKLNELKQDENELNKQVFALLVLNTFISSNPNADQNIAANQARNSASQILSQQLNNLSDQYVKGVDINFDLQSYGGNAGEGNTDLNIDLAKTFLDDRMIVRIGSTIALESNNVNTENEQSIMTNVAVEYKLTPDGRYRFKVYSKTDMEDIVVGRITRTGAGILFQRDFDRIDQIFKSDDALKKADPEKIEAE